MVKGKVKVKQSHYRPWQTLRVPGGWGSQILRQSAHEDGTVVSPTHRPRALVWPEGLCQWKFPMTPSGIDPATFRFVAQCLNHCATACPALVCYTLQWVFGNWANCFDAIRCETETNPVGQQGEMYFTFDFTILYRCLNIHVFVNRRPVRHSYEYHTSYLRAFDISPYSITPALKKSSSGILNPHNL
jgi:hypothetical protein